MQRVVSKKIHRALAAVAAAALMAGCGGGSTEQIDPFNPKRVLAFGDESAVVLPSGKKYGINGLNPETLQVDCRMNPGWSQILASGYGFVFPQCNTDFVVLPQGVMYAEAGATVATVRDKIDQHMSNDGFGPRDLVGIMVGVNDIIELYREYPQQSRESLISEARARGKLLAEQANRIARANGRVLIATIFDVGLTPFAYRERQQQTDIDRARFLDELSSAFNLSMRLNLINDGRLIGLILVDESVQQISRFPGFMGYSNVTDAACRADVAPQDCTTSTLLPDANPSQWLWAGDTLLSPSVQARVGSLFQSRAQYNPF